MYISRVRVGVDFVKLDILSVLSSTPLKGAGREKYHEIVFRELNNTNKVIRIPINGYIQITEYSGIDNSEYSVIYNHYFLNSIKADEFFIRYHRKNQQKNHRKPPLLKKLIQYLNYLIFLLMLLLIH